jgi:hypothetical protein
MQETRMIVVNGDQQDVWRFIKWLGGHELVESISEPLNEQFKAAEKYGDPERLQIDVPVRGVCE